jgi:hypothetical protein
MRTARDSENKMISQNRLYRIWTDMKKRCYQAERKNYKYYGAKGIRICDEWLDKENGFYNFADWALSHGYADNLTIDRIDSKGNYEPINCQWKTMREQERNKSNNHPITINGVTKLMIEWAEEYNMPYKLIKSRVAAGWSHERLFLPATQVEKYITINGETKSIKEWARQSGVHYETLRTRIRNGVTGEALLAPTDMSKSRI